MDHSTSEWYLSSKKKQFEEYGSVVPPWIVSTNSHPASMEWRMGDGETRIMVFAIWWNQQNYTEEQALSYFKKFVPPPRWMMWMADVLWKINMYIPEEFEGSIFYNKLLVLGFEGVTNFQKDFDDPKWLE